jgi:AcrR family transcriptional regulator
VDVARTRDSEKPPQILRAAFEVFGETGYQATLVKDIALRAGVSTGTVYTYFRDKRQLFHETVREGWARFLAQIRGIVESERPADGKLLELAQIGFDSLRRHLPLLRGMLFESTQMSVLQESLDELCALLGRLPARQRTFDPGLTFDPNLRSSMVKLTVVGVLFSAALARPDRVDEEIQALRRTVTRMLGGD